MKNTFEKIYKQYHRAILMFIYGSIKDWDVAKDISQDVFFILLTKMEQETITEFDKYLFQTTRLCLLKHFDAKKRDAQLTKNFIETHDLEKKEAHHHKIEKLAKEEFGFDETDTEIFIMTVFYTFSVIDIMKALRLTKGVVDYRLKFIKKTINEYIQDNNIDDLRELLKNE